jgi:hypothetical protein
MHLVQKTLVGLAQGSSPGLPGRQFVYAFKLAFQALTIEGTSLVALDHRVRGLADR